MIIRFSGGLGNQMFQYAYLIAQKKRYPEEIVVADIGDFDTYKHHNGFELEKVFPLKVPVCNDKEKEKHRINMSVKNKILWRFGFETAGFPKCIRDKEDGFDETFLQKFGEKDFLWGYWQSEKYFINVRSELKEQFTFPMIRDDCNLQNIKNILESVSVAIHVRRGDYLGVKSLVNLGDSDYYTRAIRSIKEKVDISKTWFIFSDDIDWCKENLDLDGEKVVYVTNNHGSESYKDMQLMSLCEYMILANSTFSWWAAWLNERAKRIIAPKHYYISKQGYDADICPSSWERM